MDGPGVTRIAPEQRTEGPATAGMIREEAVATDRMWAGLVRTAPGMISGWHHHGDHETAIYIVAGALRMEFGSDGRDRIDGRPGDFLHVEPGAIHRESNPGDRESSIIVVRTGAGTAVVNVEGPERGT